MKRLLLITLSPFIAGLTIISQRFFAWLERELNYISMGGR